MTSDLYALRLLAPFLLLSACVDSAPPSPPCAPVADPAALEGAERLVARFLAVAEGPAAAEAMAQDYRLRKAEACGATLRLRYLPHAEATAPAFGGVPLLFDVDPAAARVTWTFGGG